MESKRLSEYVWYMDGDSKPLSEVEGKELLVLRTQKIVTRYGEALILQVREDYFIYNVITSSSRVMSMFDTVSEYPVQAKFVKREGRWYVE